MDVEPQSSERGATNGTSMLYEETLASFGKGLLYAQPVEKINKTGAKRRAKFIFKLVVCYRLSKVKNFCQSKNIRNK